MLQHCIWMWNNIILSTINNKEDEENEKNHYAFCSINDDC